MAPTETVMSKMQTVEDSLHRSLHRVDVIEKKLKTKLLTMENRQRLETELEEVKEVLKRNEDKLQSLRKQNSKSFLIAGCLVIACYLIYGLYSMFFQNLY